MQMYLVTVAIVLAGQIGDSGGERYPDFDTAPPANSSPTADAPSVAQPWADQKTPAQPPATNQLRTTTPPAVTPPATNPPAAGLTKVTKPSELLQSLAKPVGARQLAGLPLSLAEAVQTAGSRAEQTQRVELYWDLSRVVADYRLAALEELELQSLRNGIAQASSAWEIALQAAAARKQVAQSAVQVAQLRLQKVLGRVGDNNLPLPNDLPHCGAYETKFDQIFQGRTSREAEQLSRLLPLRHGELGQRAVEATSARDWLVAVSKRRNPQSDGTQLLKAYEQLALQRGEFVETAYDYNADIARYTELAVPQDIGTVRLVSMLIQTVPADNGESQRGTVQQATAEEAVPQSNNGRPRQRTFVGGRSEARRVPAEPQREGERSILVRPGSSGQ